MNEPAPVPNRCAAHPDVETNLRCGKCGTPICPKCMVTTPVGARCRECARLYVLPTYRISFVYYLRAVGAALATAIAIGVAWSFLRSYLGSVGPILTVLVGYGAGMGISFMMGLAVNRKRGIWLAVIGVIAVLICFGLVELIFYSRYGDALWHGYPYIMTIVGAIFGSIAAFYRLR